MKTNHTHHHHDHEFLKVLFMMMMMMMMMINACDDDEFWSWWWSSWLYHHHGSQWSKQIQSLAIKYFDQIKSNDDHDNDDHDHDHNDDQHWWRSSKYFHHSRWNFLIQSKTEVEGVARPLGQDVEYVEDVITKLKWKGGEGGTFPPRKIDFWIHAHDDLALS